MDPKRSEPTDAPAALSRSWTTAIRDEIRSRPFTYATCAALTLLGPVAARMILPDGPLSLVITGGVMLGCFYAFCALANKLFE